MRGRRVLAIVLGVVVGIAALALIAVVGVTNTDPGRRFVRKQLLGFLQQKVHGIVRVGAIEGNLLTGATIHDLSITDSGGVPFLTAEEVQARYSLKDFWGKKLWFRDVRLVRPLIMFDKPPGGEWITKRLFPGDQSDTLPDDPNAPGGWGDWLALYDVTVVDGRAVVRAPWNSSDTLTPAQRTAEAMEDLAEGTRLVVVKVPGGYQKVTEVKAINGFLPRIILEDDYRDKHDLGRLIEARGLALVALPFKPPAVEVRSATGVFEFDSDSLWFKDTRAQLPNSSVTVTGHYNSSTSAMRIDARAAPAAFADFRWVYPRMPSSGGGTLDFRMRWDSAGGDDYLVRNADLATYGATARGDFGVLLRHDSVIFHDVAVQASGLDTRLIEQLAPAAKIPVRGTLGGRLAMEGPLSAMQVDGDLTFASARAGRSRVIAVGEVGMTTAGIRAAGLRVRAEPFHLALAHILLPTFPLGGTVQGRATVTGAGRNWRVADADVTHLEQGARSRITGFADVRLDGRTFVNMDLVARPVALATIGRFTPALGLRGEASGPIRLTGPMRDLALDARLRTSDGGAIRALGRLDLASREKGYDVALAAELFDANAVLERAPRTTLTATARATGRGFSPATMRATLAADLKASTLDSLTVDSARVRLAAADGMLRVEDVTLRGPGTSVVAKGSFGLAAGRTGELAFNVNVDSLSKFARWLPRDTGYVAPRPGVAARALEKARADSAQLAEKTEVARAVTGAAAPALAPVDTMPAVRRDSIAGSVYAAGTLEGNITAFDARGRAAAENLLVMGNSVKRLRSEFAWLGVRTPQGTLVAGAQADSAMVSGFALDSADARVTWRDGHGTAQLLVRQDDKREYGLRANYALHANHNEVHFDQLRMRFDTTHWASTRPGALQWGNGGVEFKSVELTNGARGRIYVDGMLSPSGSSHLDIAVSEFEIGNVTTLLQSDIQATGKLSVVARVDGTTRDPRVTGAIGLANASYGGTAIPDLRGTVNYAAARLTTTLDASRGGAPLAQVRGSLPVNLAAGATGPRLDRNAELILDVDADSLPLDVLPKLSDAVADVRGRTTGLLRMRGTIANPTVVGALALDLGSFRIVPTGTHVRNLVGHMRVAGDTVVVDSLVGFAGGGPVRIAGGIGIANLLRPSLDLQLVAQNARLINNEQADARADATLEIFGPFERVYVSGRVRVREGVIYIPEPDHKETISAGDPAVFGVIDTAVVAERELLPGSSPFLENLRMDIALAIDRDTWVRSREANVEVFSDGDLTISVDRRRQAIALEGVISTERGSYTYLGKRFEIRRGSATFIGTPELNPTLQATGEYEVRIPGREALFIRLLIGGTLNSLNLALESDAQPPIPQSDLLSYLAFGRSSSSLLSMQGSGLSTSGSGGDLFGATAALASQQLASVAMDAAVSELEGEAARELGADVFNISPADLPPEIWRPDVNTFVKGTEVEFGKYFSGRNFLGAQLRLDPRSAPGLRYEMRQNQGLRFELSFSNRYLLQEPSLNPEAPARTGVFGAFVIREWRF